MPVQYQDYGGYSTAPVPASASQLANWQQSAAQATANVRAAAAQKSAGEQSNSVWQTLGRQSAQQQTYGDYNTQMTQAGMAGSGRNAGVQAPLANTLAQGQLSQYATLAQQTADRNRQLQSAYDNARQQQILTNQSITQQQALAGSDPSQLISAYNTIRSVM